MKLSEEILKGCSLTGETHQSYSSRRKDGGDGCDTCAMGAAYYAVTQRLLLNEEQACELFPILKTVVEYPCKCANVTITGPLYAVINHLHYGWFNVGIHLWTREAIALWVETIEKKLEATGDKGAEAGDAKSAPPPCSQEIKDCTPVEVSTTA